MTTGYHTTTVCSSSTCVSGTTVATSYPVSATAGSLTADDGTTAGSPANTVVVAAAIVLATLATSFILRN